MRSVIISVIILLITLTFVSINAVLVRENLIDIFNIVSEIEDISDPDNKSRIDKLIAHWNNAEPYFSLTTHRADLGEVEHRITNLAIAFYKGDEYEFAAAKSSIIDILGEISSAQGFDIKSVF